MPACSYGVAASSMSLMRRAGRRPGSRISAPL